MAKERITEIDLLRTLAIALMVIFHTAYDLWAFYDWQIDIWGTQWQILRILTASLFLILAGVSSNFSRRPLKRSLIVIACALLISAVTYVYDSNTFIYFGILHCIGFGMLLLIPLKHLKEFNILLGIAVVTLLPTPNPPLPTLDYYPLIPWFGLMLIGAGLGHYLYIRNNFSTFQYFSISVLVLPGRHALLIYMIHQPILLAVLYLLHTW